MVKVDISHLKRKNLRQNEKPKSSIQKLDTEVKGNNLLPQEIDVTFELAEDRHLNDYLILKSKELIGVQANARLELGKIFQEVHDKLAGNKHTGLYVKWLGVNGYNKMTALRHRNRYELYEEMSSDNGKMIAATAPQRLIEAILSHEDRINVINRLNSSMTKEELVEALEEKQPIIDVAEAVDFDVEAEFNSFKKMYNKVDISRLSSKQQNELRKLLEKFNKLFQGIK